MDFDFKLSKITFTVNGKEIELDESEKTELMDSAMGSVKSLEDFTKKLEKKATEKPQEPEKPVWHNDKSISDYINRCVEAQVEAAVEKERDACFRIAEETAKYAELPRARHAGQSIANQIAARGKK